MWHSRFREPDIQLKTMLVIAGVSRLDNDRIEIGVARLQHDSNPIHNYSSEKEYERVISGFGISEETTPSHLKLLAQMGASELLRFPPMYILQNEIKRPSAGCSGEARHIFGQPRG
jgi:hypothetical protein